MADKTIGELTRVEWNERNPQESIQPGDLFVLEQSGTAKALTGQILVNWLVLYADGHGGIQSVEKTSTSGLVDTYTITYADAATSTFTVTNGAKGDTGDADHVWVKYSYDLPTRNADMHDEPDNYIGIYSGTSSTAPTAYTSYTWFNWKGEKGDTGTAAKLLNPTVTYVVSDSGSNIPADGWQSSVPIVTPGYYLWTRTRLPWNDGTTTNAYSVSRFGIDGQGAVSTVNSVGPDANGNVVVAPNNIIIPSDNRALDVHLTALEASVTALEKYKPIHFTMTLSSANRQVDDERITSDMRVFNPVFGTPTAVRSEITYTTGTTNIVFSGTIEGTTTFDFDLMKVDS